MRALSLAAACLAACGGAPTRTEPVPAPPVDARAFDARGLPGALPWRALILVGDGVDDLEVYATWYALAATGWRVAVAGPSTNPARSAVGRPIPVTLALSTLDPTAWDVLFVPAGAPADPVVARFAAERALAFTAAGARAVEAAGVTIGDRLPSDDEMVKVTGNVVACARTGDLPALVHALGAWAQDHLPAQPLAP